MQLNKFGITNKIWDDLMKQNENIDIIQNALTGALFKDVSGQKDVELSEMEATNGLLVFTGTLTDNVTVTVPNVPRVYHVQNQTSGDYTLTIKTGAGNGVLIQQASLPNYPRIKRVLCDGSNIVWADGSQIVEDNLHEETPDNGHYVRLASGLQKCWRKNISVVGTGGAYAQTSWPFPASFLPGSVPAIFANPTYRMASGSQSSTVMYTGHAPSVNANGVSILRFICPGNFSSDIELFADVMAIGRWK